MNENTIEMQKIKKAQNKESINNIIEFLFIFSLFLAEITGINKIKELILDSFSS